MVLRSLVSDCFSGGKVDPERREGNEKKVVGMADLIITDDAQFCQIWEYDRFGGTYAGHEGRMVNLKSKELSAGHIETYERIDEIIDRFLAASKGGQTGEFPFLLFSVNLKRAVP